MRCITRTDLVDIMQIKDGTDDEGEMRKVGNNLKHQAEENLDAPLTQIMHMGVGGVQGKVLNNLPERKMVNRDINTMKTKK
jgi:hypothetical protein